MSRRAPLLLVAALLACSPAPAATAPDPSPRTSDVGAPITLKVGQSVTVGTVDPLTVTFRRVESDSRCPQNVQCVWAGDAAVELRLARGGRAAGTTLHTTLEPREVEYDGFRVRLVQVTPAPTSGAPIAPSAYEITLEVTGP